MEVISERRSFQSLDKLAVV